MRVRNATLKSGPKSLARFYRCWQVGNFRGAVCTCIVRLAFNGIEQILNSKRRLISMCMPRTPYVVRTTIRAPTTSHFGSTRCAFDVRFVRNFDTGADFDSVGYRFGCRVID